MITSVHNDNVKAWKKLKMGKNRIQTKTFFIEGFHLIEEAYKSKWEMGEIILMDGVEKPAWIGNFPVTVVSDNVFKQLTSTKTPQGIAAIVKMKQQKWKTSNFVLLIDAIQDPGNLGTIIRTADAAGFDAVILGNNTVDVYNEKVIRSTQGSFFHIPIFQKDLTDAIMQLKQDEFEIWASALTNATAYQEQKRTGKTALIVGNEGAGIQPDILQLADMIVNIPIHGKAESLNVSVAAGILMYYIKN